MLAAVQKMDLVKFGVPKRRGREMVGAQAIEFFLPPCKMRGNRPPVLHPFPRCNPYTPHRISLKTTPSQLPHED